MPTQEAKAPVVAWLVPLAALLSLVGAFTPWFRPKATVSGHSESTTNALYSWEDGRIGLLAPILLVVLAVGVVGLLRGKAPARFSRGSAHPVATAGKLAILFGGISLVCAALAWFFVKSQYKFPGPNGRDLSWDDFIKAAKQLGVDVKLSRGPEIGYFLTIVAAVLAIVGGVLMILAARNATTASTGQPSTGYPPAGQPSTGYPPAGQPSTGYPPAGYPPAGAPLARVTSPRRPATRRTGQLPAAAQHQEPPPPSLQK